MLAHVLETGSFLSDMDRRIKESNEFIDKYYEPTKDIGVKKGSVSLVGQWEVTISSNVDNWKSYFTHSVASQNRFGGTVEYLYTIDKSFGKCSYKHKETGGEFSQQVYQGVTFIPLKWPPTFLYCEFSTAEFRKIMDLSFLHHISAIDTEEYDFGEFRKKWKPKESMCELLAFKDNTISYYCEINGGNWNKPYRYFFIMTKRNT